MEIIFLKDDTRYDKLYFWTIGNIWIAEGLALAEQECCGKESSILPTVTAQQLIQYTVYFSS